MGVSSLHPIARRKQADSSARTEHVFIVRGFAFTAGKPQVTFHLEIDDVEVKSAGSQGDERRAEPSKTMTSFAVENPPSNGIDH